jgi:hypothetical protein
MVPWSALRPPSDRRRPSAPIRATRPASRFLLHLWLGYLFASPFYVFASGNPQPADLLMAGLMLLFFSGLFIKLPILEPDLFIVGASFLGYAWIVSIIYYVIYGDPHFIMSPLFLTYNMVLMAVVIALCHLFGHDFIHLSRLVMLITVAVELVAVATSLRPEGQRSIGTFNDPNQLGYWTLLTLVCFFVLNQEARLRLLDLGLVAAAGYIILMSESRSTTGSFLIFLTAMLFSHRLSKQSRFALVILLLGGASLLLLIDWQIAWTGPLEEKLAELLARFGEHQAKDSILTRGSDRVWLYPEYLLLGAGEGAAFRFPESASADEMHSWLNIVFSYGVLGASLFAGMIWLILREARWRHWGFFLAPLAYGFANYGARFSLFWVLLGLIFGTSRRHQTVAQPAAVATPPIPLTSRPLEMGRADSKAARAGS